MCELIKRDQKPFHLHSKLASSVFILASDPNHLASGSLGFTLYHQVRLIFASDYLGNICLPFQPSDNASVWTSKSWRNLLLFLPASLSVFSPVFCPDTNLLNILKWYRSAYKRKLTREAPHVLFSSSSPAFPSSSSCPSRVLCTLATVGSSCLGSCCSSAQNGLLNAI